MELKINEVWRAVKDFEGKYEVSDLGNIRSLTYNNTNRIKNLATSKSNSGYLVVTLYKDNKKVRRTVHRLVAETFLNHIPDGYKKVINHINKNKEDNRTVNLEIITQRENLSDIENTTSKYVGVSAVSSGKWVSSIKLLNKNIRLGVFTSEIEASNYYKMALKNHLNGKEIVVKKASFSSKYKGVNFIKSSEKWRAYFKIKGRSKHLGVFTTEEEAKNAVTKEEIRLNMKVSN